LHRAPATDLIKIKNRRLLEEGEALGFEA